MSNTVEYVAIEMKHGKFSSCAQVMVNGKFFGNVYPTGLSYHHLDREQQPLQPIVGFTFAANDGEIVSADFRRVNCAQNIQSIANMLPPF